MRATLLAVGLFLQAMGFTTTTLAGPVTPATAEKLKSSSYIFVATQRKNGQLGSSSPIWFVWDDGKISFTTGPESWKARRIARGSPLTIRVGSEDGPTLTGTAHKVTDPAVVDRMGRAYRDKYWLAWLGLFRPRSERVTAGKTMAYVVDVQER